MAWDDTKIDDDGATAAGRLLATEYNALVTAVEARLLKSLYNANTIITADTEDTPAALTVGEQTLVGRITGGLIAALTPAQIRILIGTLDEDNMVSDSDTALATQQSIKKYVDDSVVGTVTYMGKYDAATNTPDLDTAPSGVLLGDMYIVSVAGTFFTTPVVIGDTLIANTVGASIEADWDVIGQYLYEASDVPNTPAGNIAATDVQAAINELDGQDSDLYNLLNTHEADTSTHGVTGAILGTEDKDVANGVAGLDASADISLAQIPDTLTGKEVQTSKLIEMADQSFTNLLKNGDFESWSAGNSAAPDGWIEGGPGSVAREATIKKHNSASIKLISSGADSYVDLYVAISNYAYYASRTVTLGMWVYADNASTGIVVEDDVDRTNVHHSGGGGWEWLTVTRTIDATPTKLWVYCNVDVNSGNHIGYFDGAILVEGSVCPAFSPHPTDQTPTVLTSAPTDAGTNGETRWYAIAGAGGARRLYMSNGTDWRYVAIST